MASAIIMAGGQSLRMRESLGQTHKALVKVLGVTMLERNLAALLSHGFTEIFFAVNAKEKSVLAYARNRGTQLARACNAELKFIVERSPLGTIGAAAKVCSAADDLVVVNVDNLTTLDLAAFLQYHRSRKAAMTIATHTEPFQIPFGRVTVKEGSVTAYEEKPAIPVLLSSGTYVLNKTAIDLIPTGRAVGAPELCQILLRRRRTIAAFEHSSPWIDVNDAASVRRAETLIMEHSSAFEQWRGAPDRDIVIPCILKHRTVAIYRNGNGIGSMGRLPGFELANGEHAKIAVMREFFAGRIPETAVRTAFSFDEIDTSNGRRTRYYLVLVDPGSDFRSRNGSGKVVWAQTDKLSALLENSYANARTIRYLERFASNSHSVGH